MTTADVRTDDEAGVTIRCRDNASVGVTFRDWFSFDADSVHYAVELRAPGLTARVNEVVARIRDGDLAPFLEADEQMTSLAADVRAFLAGEHQ
ncbi:DUF6228 family protein [Streptomyces sp. NPDC020875]|uniref:DUF6228 family protein n=1 Tax=Streptomyces sp. NPDC020875 TaxID=3154898 RepID=UPI0033E9CB67